jgi:hypothetical protein
MKMKFAAAAAMLALTGSAFAASITIPDPLDSYGEEGYTLPTQFPASPNTSFTDDIFFTLVSKADVEAGFAAVITKTKGVTFNSFTLTRGSNVTPISYSLSSAGSLLFTGLKEGSYKLELTGTTKGLGSSYYGNLTAAPAVPEPESIALAFAGLGVVGALARRRKNA